MGIPVPIKDSDLDGMPTVKQWIEKELQLFNAQQASYSIDMEEIKRELNSIFKT